jgi:SMI1/KNR4 family protein
LQWIHNSLANKELGDHIFFEGFTIEGYEEDGTPVISLELGS